MLSIDEVVKRVEASSNIESHGKDELVRE